MKAPATPIDEAQRLASLRSLNLLDTPPEERFDRLTRLARRVLGVPIALVSLVDEHRQWFKSSAGLSASETPREISFCGHAILGDGALVVADAALDERFADNPLVSGDPNIRFYAGCPLRALDGHKLGTLCVIDRRPRTPSAADLEALQDLAALVERELAAVQLATLDELTDLSNRRGFLRLARHSLGVCRRQRLPASLVFMDLDGFKPINDTYGHAEGDRALAAFAAHLKASFRHSDLYARLGGDEFAVLLTDAGAEWVEAAVARFRAALDRYNREADRGYAIDFSHGVVEFDPGRHDSVESLLAEGDASMYRCKQGRRAGGTA